MSDNSSDGVERQSFWVAYDTKHQTAAEIWSEGETLIARLPWGETHLDDAANEIFKAAIYEDRILLRKVHTDTDQ